MQIFILYSLSVLFPLETHLSHCKKTSPIPTLYPTMHDTGQTAECQHLEAWVRQKPNGRDRKYFPTVELSLSSQARPPFAPWRSWGRQRSREEMVLQEVSPWISSPGYTSWSWSRPCLLAASLTDNPRCHFCDILSADLEQPHPYMQQGCRDWKIMTFQWKLLALWTVSSTRWPRWAKWDFSFSSFRAAVLNLWVRTPLANPLSQKHLQLKP